jgi:hypothetical protein
MATDYSMIKIAAAPTGFIVGGCLGALSSRALNVGKTGQILTSAIMAGTVAGVTLAGVHVGGWGVARAREVIHYLRYVGPPTRMLLDWGYAAPFNKFCRWLRNPLTYEEQNDANRYAVELDHWDVDYPEVDDDVLAEPLDATTLVDGSVEVTRRFTRPQRHRFAGNAARAAKVRFSLPVDNHANRLAVHAFLREWMRDHGHRPSHIARDLPIAVELVFCPSESELLASRLRSGCDIVAERHRAMPKSHAI